ncbi:MAG: YegS/Rv2252/BmrU family lipid kinase [Oscillospiraceae bacterium]|nr:YegS/Rv2252/BmrU family lipid kinase [Oscillospiraceae bacterium]
MKHLFIINPVAGGRRGHPVDVEIRIREFTDTISDPYEIYVTKEPMDACRKIIEEAETGEDIRVYACGGDGTLNECANGAAGRKNVAITHYPCGTGNDFLKTFGRENVEKFHDLDALADGEIRPLDLIDCNGRYCINICSVGIDARIGNDVHKYSNIPIIGGSTGYIVSLIVNVIKGIAQKFRIAVGDKIIDKKITLACACNGQFYGGGFNPVPNAVPDDGIMDILIAEPVSRFKVAQLVGKYSKGKYAENPEIFTYIQSTEMEVTADREFIIGLDGEAIYGNKVIFKLIPKAVNFIFPRKFAVKSPQGA